MADNPQDKKAKWLKSIAALLAAIAFSVGGSLFFSHAMQNQDASIVMSFVWGCLLGVPAGQYIAYLWIWS